MSGNMRRSGVHSLLLCALLVFFPTQEVLAADPPQEFRAEDAPNDAEGAIALSWLRPEGEKPDQVWVIYMASSAGGPFDQKVAEFKAGQSLRGELKIPFWAGKRESNSCWVVVTLLDHIKPEHQEPLSLTRKLLNAFEKVPESQEKRSKAWAELLESKGADAFVAMTERNVLLGADSGSAGHQAAELAESLRGQIFELEQTVEREQAAINSATYFFQLALRTGDRSATFFAILPSITEERFPVVVSATARGNWFNSAKWNNFFYMIVFSGIILAFIALARRRKLFLRRIPGLDAVEEAVGRATEMGRPLYFLTGRDGMTNVSTIAATVILGEIAKKTAQYDTTLKVPHTDPIVMAVCQEITRESYLAAGRPDAYREDSNFFVTDDQFAYTAAVNGLMMREKPGACFYMGYYYAESLLLAEVGASSGAIQIAGTDADHQLPFFVTACDYTLIGEELYAASAYLSREPVLLGTLRGQDVGKAFLMIVILLGVIIATLGVAFGQKELAELVLHPFRDW